MFQPPRFQRLNQAVVGHVEVEAGANGQTVVEFLAQGDGDIAVQVEPSALSSGAERRIVPNREVVTRRWPRTAQKA